MNADVHHLVAAYALDALDGDERSMFEAHLAGCGDCQAELRDFELVVGELADADATAPPVDLKARVMRVVADTVQVEPEQAPIAPVVSLSERRRRFAPATLLASAAAVALLVVGAVVLVGLRDGGDRIGDLQAAPDAVTLELAATPDGAVANVEIVWSDTRDQVAVIASGLPDPGVGFVYELWAITDAPVPTGPFDSDDGSIRAIADIADIQPVAWGVTIEPEGGSPTPTLPILYFAEV